MGWLRAGSREEILNQHVHAAPRTQKCAEEFFTVVVECSFMPTLQQLAKADDRPEPLLQVVACDKGKLLKIRIRWRERILQVLASGVVQADLRVPDQLSVFVAECLQDPVMKARLRSLRRCHRLSTDLPLSAAFVISLLDTGGPVLVRCDKAQLSLMFQNLLSDSLKYRKLDETLTIYFSAASENGDCVIAIRGNGIGFDHGYAERISGSFKRLHTEADPGTGVALTL